MLIRKKVCCTHDAAAAFLGVAAFFAGVFLVVAFLAAGFAGPLVTRPDLVFPRTFSSGTMAGACEKALTMHLFLSSFFDTMVEHTAAGVLRLLEVLALGFTAFLAAVAFFGAATFDEAFFGAAFLAAGALAAFSL